ncbi:hypothetical protein CCR75_001694 [Bremia lactucae]|uniref:Uncharacterized protein n=1 Tax=Bremia lactucae TaxID=4779 RepID=A0A976FDJ4_BRELC|nr:hypothetical protein CCR75_001694 [Bremia lactucae]
MAQSNGGDDFNRLYERLVLQCTSKKKTAHNSADVHQYIEPVQQTHEVTIKLEDSRRQEKQEHDTKVASMVRCLRLARNLRRFALGIQCKSFYLACQLVDASEEEYCQFVQYCQKMIRRRKRQCFSEVERRMKLEGIAAR